MEEKELGIVSLGLIQLTEGDVKSVLSYDSPKEFDSFKRVFRDSDHD